MKQILKKLLIITIGLAVFLGIPWFFSATWVLWISWMPAFFIVMYLEDIEP